jgi:hypothetical protein
MLDESGTCGAGRLAGSVAGVGCSDSDSVVGRRELHT